MAGFRLQGTLAFVPGRTVLGPRIRPEDVQNSDRPGPRSDRGNVRGGIISARGKDTSFARSMIARESAGRRPLSPIGFGKELGVVVWSRSPHDQSLFSIAFAFVCLEGFSRHNGAAPGLSVQSKWKSARNRLWLVAVVCGLRCGRRLSLGGWLV
jgi:hypothetical protein